MLKKIILSLFLIILAFIGVANSASVDDALFVPDKPFYFAKEWSRNFDIFFTPEDKRIEKRIKISFEKLGEIRKVLQRNGDMSRALASYLTEVENLKLASESMRNTNRDELASIIIKEAYFEREILADILKADVFDRKNYALASSFGNFVSSAFYLGDNEAIYSAVGNRIDSIEEDDRKIRELDNMLVYSFDAKFKEMVLIEEIKIVENRILYPFSDVSVENYFNSKLTELKITETYRSWKLALEQEKQKEVTSEIAKGEWMNEIIAEAPGEEVEILESFKNKLADIKFEKLDQKIDGLEIYEETKEKLRNAKGKIVSSVYGSVSAEQIMGSLAEEKDQNKVDLEKVSPASAYCLRMGYRIEQRENEGIVYNACVNENGEECEDLAFYKNECKMK
ncbi:MAG: DUF333 domain-containing protein [Candidatus Paceibacterota bacterium]